MIDRPTLLIEQYALTIFCVLTIALTFAATVLPLSGEVIAVVMVLIPAFIAISLTVFLEGQGGVRSLLGKLTQWRISLRWVLIAVALGFLLRLMVSLIALGLGLISSIQLRPGGPASFVIFAAIFFVFAIPEELGWRGYALPKLLEHRSPLAAGLIVGVLWGSLHLALHLPGMMSAGLPVLPTLPVLISLSVMITWLYVQTGGNILLTSLFHGAQSFFLILNEGVPAVSQTWLMAVVYMALAFIVVVAMGPGLAGLKPRTAISNAMEDDLADQPAVQK
jgi:membrane protease YdiL (CAAX protease family)